MAILGGQQKQQLPKVGYWKDIDALFDMSGFPDPRGLVDPKWSAGERLVVAKYLDAGKTLKSWMGYSYCRFKCGVHLGGNRDLTDGRYMWPEDLSHYVRAHGVRLPKEFLDHVFEGLKRLKDPMIQAALKALGR